MKHLQLFENFSSEIKVGDMVYVNPYGPATYGYDGQHSDKPFKPKIRKFTPDAKYEIVHIDKDIISVFDDSNDVIELSKDQVSKDSPFTNKIDKNED